MICVIFDLMMRRTNQGDVHGQQEDDHEREVPGDEDGNKDDHILLSDIGVLVEQKENDEKERDGLDD